MLDKAFTHIMMEVWSVDPELVVPRVEKRVDKSVVLKVIEDRRVIQAPPSLSPQRSFEVPRVSQADLMSDGAVYKSCTSLTLSVPTDLHVERSSEDEVPPST